MAQNVPEALRRIAEAARTNAISLSLAGLDLESVPESLRDLTHLVRLDLSGNNLVALPDWLSNFTSLTTLNLTDAQLTELPDSLGTLTELTDLNLEGNKLTELPDWLGNLPGLLILSVGGNELTELPDSLGNLTDLFALYVGGNAGLVSPPPEICAAGKTAMLAFLRALQEGGEEQWFSKMVVVGEAAVGKTSVTKALCGLDYDPHEPQTHGVHVDPLMLAHPGRPGRPGTSMRLNVWDFGGQLEYRATQRFYLTDRSLFLLVWNSRRGWRSGGQVEAWLQAITNVAPGSPVIVVATHCSESVADLDEADLYRRYPRITKILQVDSQDHTGIGDLREEITRQAANLPLMGRRWPTAWITAARRLAEEPGRYITAYRADTLMEESGLDDPTGRQVLRAALHDRGDILHFAADPELRETVVLQPAWVDGMITRVLDSQQIADRGGLLSREHRAELWRDLADPGLGEILTALMERFDLAYRVTTPDHEDVALVVERLPAGRPAVLPDEWTHAQGTSELRLTYRLPSRQAGIPSWFIAREHRFTTGVAWSRGVLLRHHDPTRTQQRSMALLEDDDQAQPTIRLTVRGTEPHAFYSILNEGFTGILAERYPGLQVRRLIPCSCTPDCTHEFDHDTAQRALQLKRQLQCQQSFTMVDPRTVLLGLDPVPLEATLARMEGKLDETLTTAQRVEHSQLQVLDTMRDLLRHRAEQGARCPSIFTITKTRLSRYELRLYCEQPDGPHPLPDDAGRYQLTNLPDWLHTYAPYLRMLLTGLRYALPIVGPVISGVAGYALAEADRARLDLSCKLLDDLKDLTHDRPGLPRDTADFTQLRKALLAIDPEAEWGGLRERELPENRGIAYLCLQHREALRYPAWGER